MKKIIAICSLIAVFFSCGQINNNEPNPDREYLRSKALYYALKLETVSEMSSFFQADIKSKFSRGSDEVVLINSSKFKNLFNLPVASRNGRGNTEKPSLNNNEVMSVLNTNAVSEIVKQKIYEFQQLLISLKDSKRDPKQNLIIEIQGFEDAIHRDSRISDSDRSFLFSYTQTITSNVDNYISSASKIVKSGRCFFCSLINVIVTIVVIAAIGAVAAALLPVILAGAAATGAEILGAFWIGGAIGALIGTGYAIDGQCYPVVDYGQISGPASGVFQLTDNGC